MLNLTYLELGTMINTSYFIKNGVKYILKIYKEKLNKWKII